MPLNKNAKVWVEALRSGEYPQTTGRLKRDTDALHTKAGYCCLGVACDLYQKATGIGEFGRDGQMFFIDGNEHIDLMPKKVADWFGINPDSEYIIRTPEDKVSYSLAGDNDTGSTFLQIADIIESEPEGLFI